MAKLKPPAWRSSSSGGKESACHSGDPDSIPGSGRSPGGGIGYAHQYSWASLVAQLVKNRLQCWRPGFDRSVGKIPGEQKVYPLQYSGLENSMDYRPWDSKESDTTGWLSQPDTIASSKNQCLPTHSPESSMKDFLITQESKWIGFICSRCCLLKFHSIWGVGPSLQKK